jgi:hypothetical protein
VGSMAWWWPLHGVNVSWKLGVTYLTLVSPFSPEVTFAVVCCISNRITFTDKAELFQGRESWARLSVINELSYGKWWRHCTTNQKVAGFDSRWGEILNLPNPSGRTRPWGLLSL